MTMLLALALAAASARAAERPTVWTVAAPQDLVRGTLTPSPDWTRVNFFPERLEYEVKWGVVSMGSSDLTVREVVDMGGRPAYHVVSEARSSSFADHFYMVRDRNESWVDVGDLKSLGYLKHLREGQFARDEWVLFDYDVKGFNSHRVNRDGSVQTSTGTLPGAVQDILSSIYFIRPKKLNVGDEVTLDVNTKKNWPLVIKVLRKQRVTVPAGTFSCVVVQPFLREEGIFVQKGRDLQVWLTDDARHIPVFMRVDILIGSVSAYLSKIEK